MPLPSSGEPVSSSRNPSARFVFSDARGSADGHARRKILNPESRSPRDHPKKRNGSPASIAVFEVAEGNISADQLIPSDRISAKVSRERIWKIGADATVREGASAHPQPNSALNLPVSDREDGGLDGRPEESGEVKLPHFQRGGSPCVWLRDATTGSRRSGFHPVGLVDKGFAKGVAKERSRPISGE